MNIVEVCRYKYPGQIELGNINFRQPDEDILIGYWAVPNEPQPTEKELIDYGIANERVIQINATSIDCAQAVQAVIDKAAQSRSYSDGISCATYSTSSNVQWKAEAQAFIDWRDQVWNYLYALLATLMGNKEPIPSVQEIINDLPVMVWPN